MARKRKKVKDLRGVDPNSATYWEEVLRREGLAQAAGRSDRLSYVGTSQHLERIDGMHKTDVGRVAPKGKLDE